MAMPREAPALMRRHLRRRCVQCGLSADAIPASQPMECPRCGCDLAERPPRSYAQMEGLDADAPARDTERELAEARVHAAAVRWLLVTGAVAAAGAGAIAAMLWAAAR
jgi:hypothetical protein